MTFFRTKELDMHTPPSQFAAITTCLPCVPGTVGLCDMDEVQHNDRRLRASACLLASVIFQLPMKERQIRPPTLPPGGTRRRGNAVESRAILHRSRFGDRANLTCFHHTLRAHSCPVASLASARVRISRKKDRRTDRERGRGEKFFTEEGNRAPVAEVIQRDPGRGSE